MELTYSYDGPELLGTGGALKKALPLFGERFFGPIRRFLSADRLCRAGARFSRQRKARTDDRI